MLTGRPLASFRKKVLSWFQHCRRDLPWRRSKDPYRIWVSEIMLQQTRVAVVIPYYERFLQHFPDVGVLAGAREEEVLRLWAGLGYYSRARNLQKAARQMVAEHDSQFPSVQKDALQLAGIGEYTAAAILSIAYKKRLAVLDGNVARVLARLTALRGDLRADGHWKRLQKLADQLLAPRRPGDWNEAMMELGATICKPRSPRCLLCPVGEFCQARKLGLIEAIPGKRKKRDAVEVNLACLVMIDRSNNTVLLSPAHHEGESKDGAAGLLSRMWHFPTIVVAADAERELRAYIQGKLLPGLPGGAKFFRLAQANHTVTHRRITVQPFRVELDKLPVVSGTRKLPLGQLGSVPISNLTRKVAEAAQSGQEAGRYR